MSDANQVMVIGGGVSGLACAYRLQQLQIPCTLLESGTTPGGLAATFEHGGFLFESGPQSFQATPALRNLIGETGLQDELLEADAKAPRFILRNGHLLKIPLSPQGFLITSLLGARSRWKLATEALRRTQPPEVEESVAAFVRRKFGHEILEYLVSPFVSGVYAGDPERLSLRAAFPTLEDWEREYGSVLRGAAKSHQKNESGSKGPPALCSLKKGVSQLPLKMAQKLGSSVKAGARVVSISRPMQTEGSRFDLRVSTSGAEDTVTASCVVLAAPAYAAGHLVERVSARLASLLLGIAYAPVAVVAAGYAAHQIVSPPNGFGVLIPRSEGLRTLGTVWNSSLFAGRAPQGMFTMTSFAGGATDPGIVDLAEEEIAGIVRDETARVLDIGGPPVASRVWRHPKALPQYNLGHAHTVESIRAAAGEIPGLFFAGNYLSGPSLGKCVEQGFQSADAAANYFRSTK
ncbi:MAG: protoporphyrinogen oxidase [Candidatus Acidiferrales bacterium]